MMRNRIAAPRKFRIGLRASPTLSFPNTPDLQDGTVEVTDWAFDASALLDLRFHRAIVLTNGTLVAEFVFENSELPHIVLDEADVYATAIFLPEVSRELRAAMHALEQIRKEVTPQ